MKKIILRTAALLLALILTLLILPSCANTGTPLLTLEVDGNTYTYSVNLYELYLSALKGNMVASGATVNGASAATDKFWNSMDTLDGTLQTLNDYYLAIALEECKNVLIAQYLFDDYGLTLSETEKEQIENDLNELVLTDGGGSKNKLNSVLSTYGVNYDMMREHYTNMAKINAVRNHLYSLLGDNIKQEYLEENYVHFQQIFLANYNYVYVTDDNGDVIYYNTSDSSICYKKTSYTKTEDGKIVYYTDDTYSHISYDKSNGEPSYKITSDGLSYETTPKNAEELEALRNRATIVFNQTQYVTEAEFEVAIAEESDDADAAAAYTDGYYLKKGTDYSATDEDYLYLDMIVEELENMEVGEVIKVESAMGYHIVKKYEITEKAYNMEENEVWFSSFETELTNHVFAEQATPYYEQIKIDETVLAEAKNMKQVAVNHFYY
ncbi:MAG: hypothetical protein IJX80_06495 [Clostridia bacterium]|nr:hypothetical protein [Clostridia bacterium]